MRTTARTLSPDSSPEALRGTRKDEEAAGRWAQPQAEVGKTVQDHGSWCGLRAPGCTGKVRGLRASPCSQGTVQWGPEPRALRDLLPSQAGAAFEASQGQQVGGAGGWRGGWQGRGEGSTARLSPSRQVQATGVKDASGEDGTVGRASPEGPDLRLEAGVAQQGGRSPRLPQLAGWSPMASSGTGGSLAPGDLAHRTAGLPGHR